MGKLKSVSEELRDIRNNMEVNQAAQQKIEELYEKIDRLRENCKILELKLARAHGALEVFDNLFVPKGNPCQKL